MVSPGFTIIHAGGAIGGNAPFTDTNTPGLAVNGICCGFPSVGITIVFGTGTTWLTFNEFTSSKVMSGRVYSAGW